MIADGPPNLRNSMPVRGLARWTSNNGGGTGTDVYCNWSVRFSDGNFFWGHSDVAESGNYSCDGATITATRGGASTTPLLGRLDPQTGQLTWDGATYVAQ